MTHVSFANQFNSYLLFLTGLLPPPNTEVTQAPILTSCQTAEVDGNSKCVLNIFYDDDCVFNIYKRRFYKINNVGIEIKTGITYPGPPVQNAYSSFKFQLTDAYDINSVLNYLITSKIVSRSIFIEPCCSDYLLKVKEPQIVVNINSNQNCLCLNGVANANGFDYFVGFLAAYSYDIIYQEFLCNDTNNIFTMPGQSQALLPALRDTLFGRNLFTVDIRIDLCAINKVIKVIESCTKTLSKKDKCDDKSCDQNCGQSNDDSECDCDECKYKNCRKDNDNENDNSTFSIRKNDHNKSPNDLRSRDLYVNNLIVKNIATVLEGNLVIAKGDITASSANIDKIRVPQLFARDIAAHKIELIRIKDGTDNRDHKEGDRYDKNDKNDCDNNSLRSAQNAQSRNIKKSKKYKNFHSKEVIVKKKEEDSHRLYKKNDKNKNKDKYPKDDVNSTPNSSIDTSEENCNRILGYDSV